MKTQISGLISRCMASEMARMWDSRENAKYLVKAAIEAEGGRITMKPDNPDADDEIRRYRYFPAVIVSQSGTLKVTEVYMDSTGELYVNGFDRKRQHLCGVPLDETQFDRIMNFIQVTVYNG